MILINDNNYNMFLDFILKERNLVETERKHAQTVLIYMSDCFEKEMKSATIFKKAWWGIRDYFVSLFLEYKKIKHKRKTKDLTVEDKKSKILNTKKYKKGAFQIIVVLERYFQSKTLIDDAGGIDISDIEYKVCFYIVHNEMRTSNQTEKHFDTLEEAKTYYDLLIKDLKSQKIKMLFEILSEEIDRKIEKLNKTISIIKSK